MIPLSEVLIVAALMFGIGLFGVLVRRNVIIVVMCVELMLNAVNMTFIAFSRAHGEVTGQGFAFVIVALAAAEAAVGLAIVVAVFRSRGSVDIDDLTLMKR